MNKKPTSPHIQIYRWNISSLTSIMHRMSGVVLYATMIVLCWYIVYYAYQVNYFENPQSHSCECWFTNIFKSFFYIILFALVSALYYHFFNGIRHLLWDIGKGFGINTAKKTGILVIILTILAAIITIVSGFLIRF